MASCPIILGFGSFIIEYITIALPKIITRRNVIIPALDLFLFILL
jgi:hypothetical protein